MAQSKRAGSAGRRPAVFLTLLTVACGAAAGYLAMPDDRPRRRLIRLFPKPVETGKSTAPRLHWPVAALAGVTSALLIGGPPGWGAGGIVALVCVRILSRLEPKSARIRRARMVSDLPTAIDLLAACLRGGGSWHESVEAVADAIGGPLGAELTNVAARIRLGADPAAEWLNLAKDPALAALGRTAARAANGGAPIAASLARLARDQRRTARTAASTRARTAGVRAVAPLGLCFLPAFVLLGIVPAIAGIASTVLLP
jgi:Flp pilus assembly protein TadB